MPRPRRSSLRGSVQQTTTVRVRPRESGLGTTARLALAGLGILLVMGTGFIVWRSGWIHRQGAALRDFALETTQKAHFAVNDIVVEGRKQTDKDQLFAALEVTSGSPIFAFKPADAEARVAKLPWVDAVTVERHLPDTIYVHLTERVPMARWQHDNHVTVIDAAGKVLNEASPDQFSTLPLLVGVGAPAEGQRLLKTLHSFPVVEAKVTSAVRVSERRWDLHLLPNVVARLPEEGVADALKRLSALISEQKILERDIVAIDLRIPDRLVIEQPGNATTTPRSGSGEGRL